MLMLVLALAPAAAAGPRPRLRGITAPTPPTRIPTTTTIQFLISSSSSSGGCWGWLFSPSGALDANIISMASPLNKDLRAHAFAGNPLNCRRHAHTHAQPCPPTSAFESLSAALLHGDSRPSRDHKVLPFSKGRPLARSSSAVEESVLLPASSSLPAWRLGWLAPAHFKDFPADSFVYLGSESPPEDGGAHYWALDAADAVGMEFGTGGGSNFIELRTLMVAADWGDGRTMGELALAGHAKALLEWHNTSRFCGHCGGMTVAMDVGRRKQCTNDSCKKRIYPRVDPVVIMLVIDKINDRALLSRQSRYVPRMWSCLAGFIEPGESLEEAVRRETWEETGIEVGDVVYHSSQPWPVGPSSMPCQLMMGFFAYAKSLDIRVDKEELEDAQWHSREDVKKALTFAEYEKAQRTAAYKVNQMCNGVEKGKSLSRDFNVQSGELAPMFVPGPYAIAHHLITSWIDEGTSDSLEFPGNSSASSLSNL